LKLFANGKTLGSGVKVPAGKQVKEVRIPLSEKANWKGVIKSLEIKLKGSDGTDLEIDAIEVKRA
jgi:hypothetical protein